MILNSNQISGPLKDAYSWRLNEIGQFVGIHLGFVEHTYLDADLNSYHPLLSDALRAFFRHQASSHQSVQLLTKEHVIAMLQLQLYGSMDFVDIHDRLCHFVEVDFLEKDPDHPMVNIRGSMLTIEEEVLPSGQSILFSTAHFSSGIDVFRPHLDKNFPSWEERWDLGTELGLNINELARQAFTHSVQPCNQIDLTDFKPY